MDKDPKVNKQEPTDRPNLFRGPNIFLLLLVVMLFVFFFYQLINPGVSEITLGELEEQIKNLDKDGNPQKPNVINVIIRDRQVNGEFKEPPFSKYNDKGEETDKEDKERKKLNTHFVVKLQGTDEEKNEIRKLLEEHGVRPTIVGPDNTLTVFWVIIWVFLLGSIVFMWISYRRTQNQMLGGGGFLSGFSKSPAKRYEAARHPTTFKDVAGIENVKRELMEIVEYLREPEKFQKLGGRVPKGVMLNGPPGTGKTLLARAVAGEADVPFFSVNGSEFIQMFVGVGASRVRDLFKTAKDSAPSIIFIDEIDAVGRQRGAGLGGGHDEREQTLNQILSEMDGFSANESVIVLAATNRPDVLDPALLRPGRFDRHVTVNRPTKKGRIEIFKVHVRDVPLADDVDLDTMAAASVGLTGADIRNIVNEAALWAARHDKNKVEMEDFEYARDKIIMGAKREEVLSEEEKEKTAYHEAGHTLIAWNLDGAHPVHKVTVIPRGRTLGATQMLPGEDRMNLSERELQDNLVVLLGGRAAEQLVYNEPTVGAENDLERATSMARRMVTHWGMSERLGPVSYKMSEEDPFLGREIHQQRQFSEHTMELIDQEVARILHEAADKAHSMLTERKGDLEMLAKALVNEEELDEPRIAELIGPSVHSKPSSNEKTSVNLAAKDSVEDPTAKS